MFDVCLQAHGMPEAVQDNIDVREGRTLFQVCPAGGCVACFTAGQLLTFNRLHTSLSVLIKRFDPAKHNISGLPLTLLWESAEASLVKVHMLAFRTYLDNLDAVFLEMYLDGSVADLPFNLKFKEVEQGQVAAVNDLTLCRQLALLSADWKVSRLLLGDLEDDLFSHSAVDRCPEPLEDLLAAAQQMKEQERALRAVRVLQRLQRSEHRQRRPARRGRGVRGPGGRRRPQGRGRGNRGGDDSSSGNPGGDEDFSEGTRSIDIDDADDVWGLEQHDLEDAAESRAAVPAGRRHPAAATSEPSSSSTNTASRVSAVSAGPVRVLDGAGGAGADAAAEPAPVPPPAAAAAARPARRNQRRAIPWGPFLLSPIVPQHGRQTGWGAICNGHVDRGEGCSATQCKKAVSYGATLDDAACILRLKRWLIAGLADGDFPRHAQRSHHVSMGGPGMRDFAVGLSEEEMDAMIAEYLTEDAA